jgi:hypothetical protein
MCLKPCWPSAAQLRHRNRARAWRRRLWWMPSWRWRGCGIGGWAPGGAAPAAGGPRAALRHAGQLGAALAVLLWNVATGRAGQRGVHAHGDAPGCSSRRVLWSNVLDLIAQRPGWAGAGGSWTTRTTSPCFRAGAFARCSTTRTTCRCSWRWSWACPRRLLLCAALAWPGARAPGRDPGSRGSWPGAFCCWWACTACWSFRSGMGRSSWSRRLGRGAGRCLRGLPGFGDPYEQKRPLAHY